MTSVGEEVYRRTRIVLQFDHDLDASVASSAGDAPGMVERPAKSDVERFKELIEFRYTDTDAWRGGGLRHQPA